MIVRTSYFANPRLDRRCCVAVSRTQPKWWHGLVAPAFAPIRPGTWSNIPTWREDYLDELHRRFPGGEGLDLALGLLADRLGPPLVLLCWEPDPRECHRAVLAGFITDHLGVEVLEMPSPFQERSRAAVQVGLPL